MRRILASLALAAAWSPAALSAHEGSAQLRVEAPAQPLVLTIPNWTEPGPRRFGVFTVLPPTSRGEVVKVMFPVGELASRAAHALSDARQRRAVRKVRDAVQRELDAFVVSQRPRAPQ